MPDGPFVVGHQRANAVNGADHRRYKGLVRKGDRDLFTAELDEVLRARRRSQDLEPELVAVVDALLERRPNHGRPTQGAPELSPALRQLYRQTGEVAGRRSQGSLASPHREPSRMGEYPAEVSKPDMAAPYP